ncbi:beta-L-arabinofuranosidase domain-containing protein [Lacimicrobium alkaliphilum]|uniref:Glycosyl hydrolase n=1 Tax=Lacimicrobium alkaliphilum TaxID=1526571 RepID=A0A0U2ZN96_9ALTE|nr:beta-L-arabinofuranosidase domain-containing protein [Lacimicrobium alkaliphilum]ALS99756.1 glycosyl hydrolase [Lacimicrobium alkaliphilum]
MWRALVLLCLLVGYKVQAVEPFALSQVQLEGGPFLHAQLKNIDYLLELKPERLLAPYLNEAGIETDSPAYGNWESSGLDGHIGGHYLSALSLGYAASGDKRLKQRLEQMLGVMRQAQLKQGKGYLGGIPDGGAMWQQIRAGNIDADLFSLNQRWVPFYNLHKVFAGLHDAYVIADIELAGLMLNELGQWLQELVSGLTDAQIQQLLITEHGGMNDVLADMHRLFPQQGYLQLARQFSHQQILEPLLDNQDRLDGLHANTQIPKIIGFLKVGRQSGEKSWYQAAEYFWNVVTGERSVSIGGNSVREHFHASDDFSDMISDVEGPETCNTYNMQKLSKLLFLDSGYSRYLDYYERAMYNHILSSQHPQHGGLVYFTPMRPGHYRKYSSVHDSMWCCVGSGIENHSKYAELIYAHDDNELLVNLFIPSRLNWQQQGLQLALETRFPDEEDVQLNIQSGTDKALRISIRRPHWAKDAALQLKINGEPVAAEQQRQGYLSITRRWQAGDTIRFSLATAPRLEQLPDGSDYYSVLYGPVVLASKMSPFENEKLEFIADNSRMGHIADGPVCPPEAVPMILGDAQGFLTSIARLPGTKLAFSASQSLAKGEGIASEQVQLIPFFRLHDSRYQLYWPQFSEKDYRQQRQQAQDIARQQQQLQARTVDQINPGEQQPEAEHDFAGEQTGAGVNQGQHWRDASGWFGYKLRDHEHQGRILRLRYFAGDSGRRFRIMMNGLLLAEVELSAPQQDGFYEQDYVLSEEILKRADQHGHSLRFVAAKDSIAGGIYGIRLLTEKVGSE